MDQTLLGEAGRRLNSLMAAAEGEFLPVGDVLSDAVGNLGAMTDGLKDLGGRLTGEEARHAVSALTLALAEIDRMGETSAGDPGLLPLLSQQAEQVTADLGGLQRIVGEITALAINGKIQAALVATEGVDFTVFTTEIGRLGASAAGRIEQASRRLTAVRNSIAAANEAEAAFAREEEAELDGVRGRIAANIAQLADRSRRASQVIDAVGEKSRQISAKIAGTVGELQINDMTCQRIDHVRTALTMIGPALTSQNSGAGPALALATLQQQQLDRAASDYETSIEAIIDHLQALAAAAADLLGNANEAFGDHQGGLFLLEIERDVTRALAILETYSNADLHIQALMESVTEGFVTMTGDLDAIRSIDADMRVMGLNATLKCGRLGDSGKALGVVAQELRACSRRTEDMSRHVTLLLDKALTSARSLRRADSGADDSADDSSHGRARMTDPRQVVADSITRLAKLSAAMAAALDGLRETAPMVAQSLADCAGRIDFHQRVRAEAERTMADLAIFIAQFPEIAPTEQRLSEELRDRVAALYTMDSERAVHQRFDGGLVLAAPTAAAEAVDDLFF